MNAPRPVLSAHTVTGCLIALATALGCQSCAGTGPGGGAGPAGNPGQGGSMLDKSAPPPEADIARPQRGQLLLQPTSEIAQQPQQAAPAGMVTTATGLQYQDIVVGQGLNPVSGQTVVVHYTGWLTNGQKFDSSVDKGQPFTFAVGTGEVIKGWDEGVSTMRVGGRRKLVVPPYLGYGDRGAGGVIPPGATLIFEVQLLGLQ